MPIRWAAWLSSSCKAPKGHSQPQNTPRPQKSIPSATAPQRTKIKGAIRKFSHRKPESSACRKAITCTTESCAPSHQPSTKRVSSR